MNDMITVNIKIPFDDEILEGTQLPFDYTIQKVIDELIDQLELQSSDESARPIIYQMRSFQQDRVFSNYETILSSRIREGDTLEMFSLNGGQKPDLDNDSADVPPPPPPPGPSNSVPPTVLVSGSTEINVVLSVMDLNRHETVSMPISRPVGDLIKQIVANYGLPARNNLNELIKYKLQSKALGRFLPENMTLLEAQIPPLDRLTLHREEIAG